VLRRVLYGLSCRDSAAAAEAVPEAFGLSRSSISRRYVRATARKLRALQERRLDGYDFVVLVLDGKTFAEDTLVVALGITAQGHKVLRHSNARLLLVDPAFAEVAHALTQRVEGLQGVELAEGGVEALIGRLAPSEAARVWSEVDQVEEHSAITLNYTSGTTAHPKGSF